MRASFLATGLAEFMFGALRGRTDSLDPGAFRSRITVREIAA